MSSTVPCKRPPSDDGGTGDAGGTGPAAAAPPDAPAAAAAATASRPTRPGKRPPPKSRKLRDAVNSDPPVFFFENGLRKVRPYQYVYQTYAKQRWLGMTIFQVFEKEFHDRPVEFYRRAIQSGHITVNGNKVALDYVVKNSDLIENGIHRHEPPVTDSPVTIVHRSDKVLILSKPSSIPVHPTGRYRHNTVLHILQYEHNIPALFPINRIDRLTSGLLLMALDKSTASSMMTEMRERQIHKTYLARVKGEFPADAVIECAEPIETVQFKVGVNIVSPTGKPCLTTFRRLSYNGLTSVVQCEPRTGRTHQIRVHLQFLGFPIANDPVYCCSAWGDGMGRGGLDPATRDSIVQRVTEVAFPSEEALLGDLAPGGEASAADPAQETQTNAAVDVAPLSDDPADDCAECRLSRRDPIPEQLTIWLHSWKYSGGSGWQYETPMPDWAQPDFDGDRQLVDRFWAHGGLWDGRAPGEFVE
ncbi:DRAP deaminase [Polyrhizophydium stewartii]|uniref:Pseudouridine synthase n=1 Tax=Polyrhizophydium stewartii TaxID=2732419 RepID=A0ABR4NKV7_9FUNG|nr:RNA pseudouridylate synthase domain containing protein 2 [Polyrhizophydium stewartii]